MKIKIRRGPRDLIAVDVYGEECPPLRCFVPGPTILRSLATSPSGTRSRILPGQYCCQHRDGRGCPEQTVVDDPPRYRQTRGGAWVLLPLEAPNG